MWDNENYYLLGYDALDKKLKHYRVDKMMDISILRTRRLGRDAYRRIDMPEYTQYHFGMYDGDMENVTVELENDLIGVFIDRFGKKIPVTPVDDDHVAVTITAAVSRQFLGWILHWGLGSKSPVLSPLSLPCAAKANGSPMPIRQSSRNQKSKHRRRDCPRKKAASFLVLEGALNLAEDSFVRNHLNAGRGFLPILS